MDKHSTHMTPTEVADAIIPRLLGGEVLLRSRIAHNYRVPDDTAARAVQIARDVLIDQYGILLPIANYHSDFLLAITTEAVNAFYGEVPQLRALRTREQNMLRRLGLAMTMVKSRPRMAAQVLKSLDSSMNALEDSVETVIVFMEEEITKS